MVRDIHSDIKPADISGDGGSSNSTKLFNDGLGLSLCSIIFDLL